MKDHRGNPDDKQKSRSRDRGGHTDNSDAIKDNTLYTLERHPSCSHRGEQDESTVEVEDDVNREHGGYLFSERKKRVRLAGCQQGAALLPPPRCSAAWNINLPLRSLLYHRMPRRNWPIKAILLFIAKTICSCPETYSKHLKTDLILGLFQDLSFYYSRSD